MAAKPLILISLWVFTSFSALTSGEEGGIGDNMECVKKLLPCKDYLSNPVSPPPTCCYPLKQMISDDAACLCGVLNNQVFLKQFNITREDVLKLPAACGAKADISLCNKEAISPAALAPNAKTPATVNYSAIGSSTPSPTKDGSAANGMSIHVGGFILLVVSVGLTLAKI